MPVIAAWCPNDAALDVLVPLGLAVAAGTALVVDLDPEGPRVGPGPSLAELVSDGASRRHLEPVTDGVGFLANGGVDADDAVSVVRALAQRWPAVVLRCPSRHPRPDGAIGVVPLLPEPFTPRLAPPGVYQRCGFSPRSAPPGMVLPPIGRRTAELLLSGRRPRRSDRWIRAVGSLWGHRG